MDLHGYTIEETFALFAWDTARVMQQSFETELNAINVLKQRLAEGTVTVEEALTEISARTEARKKMWDSIWRQGQRRSTPEDFDQAMTSLTKLYRSRGYTFTDDGIVVETKKEG